MADLTTTTSRSLDITTKLPLPRMQGGEQTFHMPQLGFGVYDSKPQVCVNSCLSALRAGYRHIDSAQYYANESEVARAVQQFLETPADYPITREDIFLTTKILGSSGTTSVHQTHKSIIASVDSLSPTRGGYVDLFLIHSPHCGSAARKVLWKALAQAQREGRIRSIGTSNFGVKHLEEMKSWSEKEGSEFPWPPAVNQIELHPFCQQKETVEFCRSNGIVVQAYCPLVRNVKKDDKVLNGVAERLGVTTAQVLVRWSLQRGFVPLPKSDTPSRIEANADVFGFEIGEEDMKSLDGLDQGDKGAIVEAVDNVTLN